MEGRKFRVVGSSIVIYHEEYGCMDVYDICEDRINKRLVDIRRKTHELEKKAEELESLRDSIVGTVAILM